MSFSLSDAQNQQIAAANATVVAAAQTLEAAARRDPAGIGQTAVALMGTYPWSPQQQPGYPATSSYSDAGSYVAAVQSWCSTRVTALVGKLPPNTPGPDWNAAVRGSGSGL